MRNKYCFSGDTINEKYDEMSQFKFRDENRICEKGKCRNKNKYHIIFLDVPEERRLEALQSAVILLPDANREVLKILLAFTAQLALNHEKHQVILIKKRAFFILIQYFNTMSFFGRKMIGNGK